MHEVSLTGVDADVVNATLTYAKKHQVARQNLREGYGTGRMLLLGGGARDAQADALVHVERQATAVEAACIGAPEVIRRADERVGGAGNRDSLLGLLGRWRLARSWRRRGRNLRRRAGGGRHCMRILVRARRNKAAGT